MLYELQDATRRAMEPWTMGAKALADLYGDQRSGWSRLPFSKNVAAGAELFYRINKEYEKPAFGIHAVTKDGVALPVMEKVELSTPFCRLLSFQRYSADHSMARRLNQEPAILVVAPLSGHHATLLRDTVQTLLQDHRVYITDWTDARQVPLASGAFGLNDYVSTVEAFMRHLGATDLNVMAVCQPVVPVLGAISLMAARGEPTPRSMILVGGPVDSRQSPTSVDNLATEHPLSWFRANLIHAVPGRYPGAGRRVYPGFLQHMGFVAMNPQRHMKAHEAFFQDLLRGDEKEAALHRKFYDEYNAVLDMPAEYYLDTIQVVFQEHRLPKGEWEVHGERVRPFLIRKTAVLTIEGELDDIAGQGQTRAALALCSGLPKSRKSYWLAEGAGHYGLFSGSRWRNTVYPRVRDFIRHHEAP